MDFIADTIQFIIASPFIVLGWLIVGAIAGDVARRLMGVADRSGCADIVLGIIGAIIGGFIASLLGFDFPRGGIPLVIVNLIIATIGAAILIGLRLALTGGRGRART